uniref:Secreted protein n=1 Tax=Aegilops tauschii subsp. strangulata TaxID=200361 RepID=A0A453B8K4_AEGTS
MRYMSSLFLWFSYSMVFLSYPMNQRRPKEKRDCFRRLHLNRSVDNIVVAKKTAKRAVSEARGRVYQDLY